MLNDGKIKAARPQEKKYKLFDGYGLFLQINPSGSKVWRFKYSHLKKSYELTLGKYPALSLLAARQQTLVYREMLARGQNPHEQRQLQARAQLAASYSLRDGFAALINHKRRRGCSEKYLHRCQRDLVPAILDKFGARALESISTAEIKAALLALDSAGRSLAARRNRQLLSEIYSLAILDDKASYNPIQPLAQLLPAKPSTNHPRITNPQRFGELLQAIDRYAGRWQVALMLRLLPLVFVRQQELRLMRWEEIDWERALWLIPAGRMKMRRPHLVPLARQSLEILHAAQSESSGAGLVFKGTRPGQPLGPNTIRTALLTLGFSSSEMTGHGFRGSASTLLHELGFEPRYIEAQLAHAESGVKAAYNHALYLAQRREMMQFWADYLDQLKGSKT